MNNSFFLNLADKIASYDWIETVDCGNAVIAHFTIPGDVTHDIARYSFRTQGAAILCVSGSIMLSSLTADHCLTAGKLLLTSSNIVQFVRCEACEFYVVAFNSDFSATMNVDINRLLSIFIRLQGGIVLDISTRMISGVQRYFRRFHYGFANAPLTEFRRLIISHTVCMILYRICDVVERETDIRAGVKDRSAEYFQRLMQLLSANFRTERNVEFYAGKLNITPKHLSRVITRYSGKTVHQWIDNFVVLEIKNLLKTSDMSIQQIAYELNFPNPSFMGQYFKRITGMTPGEYKCS